MKTLLAFILAAMLLPAYTQSLQELQQHYTGQLHWEACDSSLHFLSSGQVDFPGRRDYLNFKWEVPRQVRRIVIAREVRVNAFFHCFADIHIMGESRESSVIFGTDEQNLLHREGLDRVGRGSVPYSAIYGEGSIVVNVQQLTVLNPFGFMFTGKENAVFHLRAVNGLDQRGGHHNHSDGISAYHGTTVRDCYFEAGDDVIKVYHDIYVENTTIYMITNSVPVQLGWGNYGSGAVGVFRNLHITGDRGRANTGNAVVDARYGRYDKTLIFSGLKVDNPNASLFDFWNEPKNGQFGGKVMVRIHGADLRVARLQQRWNMEVDLQICGETVGRDSPLSRWQCP